VHLFACTVNHETLLARWFGIFPLAKNARLLNFRYFLNLIIFNLPIIFWTFAATAIDFFHTFFDPLVVNLSTTAHFGTMPVCSTHQQLIKCILGEFFFTLSGVEKRWAKNLERLFLLFLVFAAFYILLYALLPLTIFS